VSCWPELISESGRFLQRLAQVFQPFTHILAQAHVAPVASFTVWVMDSEEEQDKAYPAFQIHKSPQARMRSCLPLNCSPPSPEGSLRKWRKQSLPRRSARSLRRRLSSSVRDSSESRNQKGAELRAVKGEGVTAASSSVGSFHARIVITCSCDILHVTAYENMG
jgi:hypothetical protein